MDTSRKRTSRVATVLAAVASVAVVAAGCGGSAGTNGGSGSAANGINLVNSGKLTVCTHMPYKPFEFRQNGKAVGFDVDMIDLLAKKLGVQTQVVNIGWAQITSGAVFAAGKCDVGMGAATVTKERKKSVRFSEPYFNATQALLVKSGAKHDSLADLKGKQLGVQTDTTGQLYAKKHADKHGYEIVVYPDSLSLFNAVKTGAVDAAINDNGTEYYFAKQNPGTKVTQEFDTGEHYGFMVAKNDKNAGKLVDKLNATIAKSKNTGQYAKIYEEWFGALPGEINAGE